MGESKKARIEDMPVQEHPMSPKGLLQAELSLPANNRHLVSIRRPALPIIFVPGIMASRLYDPEKQIPVWDPDDSIRLLRQYARKTSPERYKLLAANKDKFKVLNSEGLPPMRLDSDFRNFPRAKERGWGGVMWGAYGELIKALETWRTPLKLLLDMPVYAFGYNWMLSNEKNGENLKAFIEQTVKKKHDASHVLLITHSMGGLVARSASRLHGAESSIFGIVHGAQPALGAADAYRRMVAGQTGGGLVDNIAAQVIGPDGPRLAPILASTEAGLQLLPTKHYHVDAGGQDKAWLHRFVVHEGKEPHRIDSLPKDNDPYAEIYTQEKVSWRLVHKDWLEAVNGQLAENALDNIKEAGKFHDGLADEGKPYAHPCTIQLYSSGEDETFTFCEIVWVTEEITGKMGAICRGWNPISGRLDRDTIDRINEYCEKSPGTYSEILLVKGKSAAQGEGVVKDEDLENLPACEQRISADSFAPSGWIAKHLADGGRIYRRRLLNKGETITDETGCKYPRSDRGDETVPEMSGRGLDPKTDKWTTKEGRDCISASEGKKHATFRPNTAAHQDFFDKDAIAATLNAVNNLALLWIETHGTDAGKEFNCNLECMNKAGALG